jgi:addiction module RelE/StbE family toxin
MRIRYTPRARDDLDSIFSYLVEYSPASAIRLERLNIQMIDGLRDFPEIGPATDSGARVLLVGRFPYRVFYRVEGDEVQILHIRHTSRRPWIGEDE